MVVAGIASVLTIAALPAVAVQFYSNVVRISGGPQEQSPAFIYPTSVGNAMYFDTLAHMTLTTGVLTGLLALLTFRILAGPWNGLKAGVALVLCLLVVAIAIPVAFVVAITALLGPLMLALLTAAILWIAFRGRRKTRVR
jgi:uncharacterized membrane protein